VGGLIGLTVTGIPAVMAVATQEYESNIFWLKMYILAFAIVWTFTVRRKVTNRDAPGAVGALVGLVSTVAWLAVAASARLIMYL
jgi:hypothetical protein